MTGHVIKSFQFYGYAVIQILIEPRLFFTELSYRTTWGRSLGFCMICSLFYVTAGLMAGTYANPAGRAGIFFFNSMGLMVISAVLGHWIMKRASMEKPSFEMILSIQSFSWGVPLLVSWMPVFAWISEPWKWWLVYTGFKHTCGLPARPAAMIMMTTMGLQVFIRYALYLFFL